MKKKWIFSYYIILVLFCLVPTGASAISEGQKNAISENCLSIKDSLRITQRVDSRTRVYLGGKFETILTKFIKPLNVKLIENNISDLGLIENQSSFVEARAVFSSDFIRYQQSLEELIGINCEAEPEIFYDKLLITRERRRLMSQDISKIKKIILNNVQLVTELRSNI